MSYTKLNLQASLDAVDMEISRGQQDEGEDENKETKFGNKKLKIGIATVGSRGDLQPYIAIGLYLQNRGHSVVIATEDRMKPLVEEFGLTHRKIVGDVCGILFTQEFQKQLQQGSLLTVMRLIRNWEAQWDKIEIYNSYLTALEGSDIIIAAGLSLTQALCTAEKLNVPFVPYFLGPVVLTSEFPIWPMEPIIPCSCLNKWSYKFFSNLLWSLEKKSINAWRKQIGLVPIHTVDGAGFEIINNSNNLVIIASSPMLSPCGRVPSDYRKNIAFHGFVYVPTDQNIPIDVKLQEFIDRIDSRPVIYLGFGSMPAPNPEALIKMSLDICKLCDCRAVLVAGWSQLSVEGEEDSSNSKSNNKSSSENELRKAIGEGIMYCVKVVNHEWLLPQMKCIVHHGGIGTTAASLRAGSPQVICPFLADQPHNARHVIKLGCSPGYVRFDKHINAKKVSKLIKQVLSIDPVLGGDNKIAIRAREVGEMIRVEAEAAHVKYCELIESFASVRIFYSK